VGTVLPPTSDLHDSQPWEANVTRGAARRMPCPSLHGILFVLDCKS